MKLVYLAGPYRAKHETVVWSNIMAAREVAETVLRLRPGWFPVTPHLNTMLMGGIVNDEVFLAGDLEILARCDAILMIPGWEQSSGARAEKAFAEVRMPVFETIAEMPRLGAAHDE